MNYLLIFIVWAIGVVLGYFIFKKNFTRQKIKWTSDLRMHGILIGLFGSWFCVVTGVLMIIFDSLDKNKEVKW